MKTPLIYDVDVYKTSGHCEKLPREHVLRLSRDEDRTYALKPMNCPGHMLLFGNQLRSYRELPLRFAESSTLHRDELERHAARPPARAHITQDDAHIFCTREQIEDEIFGCLDYAAYLYDLFGMSCALRALDAAREQARHRRGVGLHRGRAAARRSSGAASSTT